MKDAPVKECTRRDFLKNTARLCMGIGLPSILPGCSKEEATITRTATPVNEPTNTGSDSEPAYLELHRTGELKRRAEKLWNIMERCRLCPRRCGVNRLECQRRDSFPQNRRDNIPQIKCSRAQFRPPVGPG